MGVKATLMIMDHEKIDDIPEGKGITREEVQNLQISKVEGIQEEEYLLVMEGPLMMEDTLMMEDPLMIEDPLIMEDLLMIEDPLMMEDPLIMEDPLMMDNPLIMEDPQEMEDHQEDLEDKDHQVPPGLDLYVQ